MRTLKAFAFLLIIKLALAGSLYDSNDDVVELTFANFDSSVTGDSSNAWIVNFYAPWCRYSKSIVPVYKQVATNLRGKVKVGAVNCDDHPIICNRYKVEGYPTIRIFIGPSSTEYEGEHTVSGISEAASELAPKKKKNNRRRPRVQRSTMANALL